MNEEKCEYPIIIADGGLDLDVEKTINNNLNFQNIKYKYIRYKYDENLDDYYNKLVNVISMVETDYFIFADNDDFILFENIDLYINYLDKNPEYVSCGGRILDLEIYKRKKLTNQPYGDDFILKFFSGDRSVEQTKSVNRLINFFSIADQIGLWNTWYFVQRTSVVKSFFNFFIEHRSKEIVVFEILFHSYLLKYGKYKFINSNFILRQVGSSQLTGEINKNGGLVARWLRTNAFDELNYALKHLSANESSDWSYIVLHCVYQWFKNQSIKSKNYNKIKNLISYKSILEKFPFIKMYLYKKIFPHKKMYYDIELIKKYITNKENNYIKY
jgi:glycosyltransferase domain-containing protein